MASSYVRRVLNRAIVALFAIASATASAQDRGFALERYDGTSAGSENFLVERPWYSSVRFFAVGVTGDYAHNPLRPKVATGRGPLTPIISSALLGHVDVAGSFLDRVQLSASLPVTFLETGTPELVSQVAPLQTIGIGDPRVGLLVRIAGQQDVDGISLHLGATVWIPIGGAATHQGDTGLRVMPRAILAGAFGEVGRWTVDAAFLYRPYASFGPPALGMTAASEARLGFAFGASLLNHRLTIGPEAQFSVQVVGDNAFAINGMNLELLGGAQYVIADSVLVGVAGGSAFFGAAGTPDARGLVRLAWAPRPSTAPRAVPVVVAVVDDLEDPDRDGVPTAIDRCPFEPETKNGVRDEDGCPEFQMAAGTPLAKVLAPKVDPKSPRPETGRGSGRGVNPATTPDVDAGTAIDAGSIGVNRPVALNEPTKLPPLPDPLPVPGRGDVASSVDAGTEAVDPAIVYATQDSDNDGVVDDADRCPVTAEDPDGFEDEDGCPELDNDEDSIVDTKDQCPVSAETANGVSDDDGCPDLAPDADNDGIADVADRCPYEAETRDGVRDDDGCPEFKTAATPALARMLDAEVPLNVPAPLVPYAEDATQVDSDKDGITDDADRCPASAEDPDGFEDEDGCREPDNDDDGVADAKDQCPEAAETINGWKDDDGCPDEHQDLDGDGVEYEADRCPLEPGNASDGCPHAPPPALVVPTFATKLSTQVASTSVTPEPTATELAAADFDKDGTPDEADPCPMSAEDRDDFEDEDGCPELDNDHDGIPDAADKCPFVAETINGNKDDDGCPDVGVAAVSIKAGAVVINDVVRFQTGSANLTPASMPLLKQVAATLRAASSLSIEIRGHTDDVGSAPKNITLSKKRADTIRAVLIKAGVAATRLTANGYGPTKPIASNKTPKGREQNRRVEFLILGESK